MKYKIHCVRVCMQGKKERMDTIINDNATENILKGIFHFSSRFCPFYQHAIGRKEVRK